MANPGGNREFPYWRDVVLFVTATALLVYEAVGRSSEPRWALLVVYAGILGVPLVLPRPPDSNGGNREGNNGDHSSI